MLIVLPVAEAQQNILQKLEGKRLPAESVLLSQALGRVTAEEITAVEDSPPFTRATMDGFAVRSRDTFGATEAMPAFLALAGTVPMGQAPTKPLQAGEAIGVATGAAVPEGADAVVMVEHTEKVSATELAVYRPAAPGENIIMLGEDYRQGQVVLPAGRKILPQDIGVLAGLGITRLEVYCRPRVAIVSTGDELVHPDQVPGPGQIRDINSLALAAQVEEAGGVPLLQGIVPDQAESLEQALKKAREVADLVVVSGGSSVGARDATAQVMDRLGSPGVLFHGVSMRPGKPLIFAMIKDVPFYGLSGNPVSALIAFDLFVRPALYSLQGMPPLAERRRVVRACLARNIASAAGREDFIRVRLNQKGDQLWAEPLLGASGLMRPLVEADGLVRISRNSEGLPEGAEVDVITFPRL